MCTKAIYKECVFFVASFNTPSSRKKRIRWLVFQNGICWLCVCARSTCIFITTFGTLHRKTRDVGTWSWTVLIIGFFHLHICSFAHITCYLPLILLSDVRYLCALCVAVAVAEFLLFLFVSFVLLLHSLHRCKQIFTQRLTTWLLICSMCTMKNIRERSHTPTYTPHTRENNPKIHCCTDVVASTHHG